jgi:hypothetical protein
LSARWFVRLGIYRYPTISKITYCFSSRTNIETMPISVLAYYTRRPDFSPAEFRRYMEEVHIPILKDVMGVHYPTSYPRRYPLRTNSGLGKRLGVSSITDAATPVVLVGLPEDFGWDMIGEFIFRDELHLQQGYATINSDDGQRVKDDEENFTIPHLFKVIVLDEITAA